METNSVLVAEDDPLFRRILESWLGKWEYRVTAAEDGLKAWQVLEKRKCATTSDPGLDYARDRWN